MAMMEMLKERWRQFSQRERIIVAAGGAVVAAALVFLLIVDPLVASIDKLDRQARRKAKDSQELALVAQEYLVKQARIAKLEQRMPTSPAQFSLLAFMEEATTTAQIRDRIVGMQPQAPIVVQGYQETAVDLRLDGVTLPQVLALLVAIEQAPYDVQVHHLQMKPKYDNPVNLDATLRIVTYAKV
jgi:general secretion pathway protein M